MKESPLCVLLVVGGDSAERDVSLNTGTAVYEALKEKGHRVFVTDPMHPEIKPTEEPRPIFEKASIKKQPPKIGAERFAARRRFLEVLGHHVNLSCDIVFNALHGGAGEDGTIQSVLDYLGVRYTGSGAAACQVAMDKDLAKRVAAYAGVPTPKQLLIDSAAHEHMMIDEKLLETLSFPVVVKPNHEGSSVGVTIVHDRAGLDTAIAGAKEFGGAYLVENFIPGREITVAMMDYHDLPVLEIRPNDGFYDYENKYQAGMCEYLVPAPLEEPVTEAIKKSAQAAYRAIGLRGYARIDFRLTEEGQHFFLEANTLPGLTANSLFPKAAKGAGLDYPSLVDTILRLSLAPKTV